MLQDRGAILAKNGPLRAPVHHRPSSWPTVGESAQVRAIRARVGTSARDSGESRANCGNDRAIGRMLRRTMKVGMKTLGATVAGRSGQLVPIPGRNVTLRVGFFRPGKESCQLGRGLVGGLGGRRHGGGWLTFPARIPVGRPPRQSGDQRTGRCRGPAVDSAHRAHHWRDRGRRADIPHGAGGGGRSGRRPGVVEIPGLPLHPPKKFSRKYRADAQSGPPRRRDAGDSGGKNSGLAVRSRATEGRRDGEKD